MPESHLLCYYRCQTTPAAKSDGHKHTLAQRQRLPLTVRAVAWATLVLMATVQLPLHAAPAPDLPRIERHAEQLPRLHSLLINQGGELIYEKYFNGRRANQP